MLRRNTKRPRMPDHYRDGEAMDLTALQLLQATLALIWYLPHSNIWYGVTGPNLNNTVDSA